MTRTIRLKLYSGFKCLRGYSATVLRIINKINADLDKRYKLSILNSSYFECINHK